MSRVTAWYVSSGNGGSARGPFATDLVRAMLRDGQLNAMDLVFREGESEWRPASMFAELRNLSSPVSVASEPESAPIENVVPNIASSDVRLYSESSARDEAELNWIVLRPHSSTYLQEGPFKTDYIRKGLKKGLFQFSQYAWHVGMRQWMRIGDLREFDRRSSPREKTPHVPPPLPDPITAVILEDDGDFESEEFHVSLKPSKFDATPTDPTMIFGVGKETVAIGGAAAQSPELTARDLAKVPWEQSISSSSVSENSGVFAKAVELIDDESSFHKTEQDDEPQTAISHIDDFPVDDLKDEPAPQPFVSRAPTVGLEKDGWEKWGRYVAAVGLGAVAAVFSGHLITTNNSANAAISRRAMERNELKNDSSQSVAAVPSVSLPASPAEVAESEPSAPALSAPTPTASAASAASAKSEVLEHKGLDLEDPMAGPEGGLSAATAPQQAAPQMTASQAPAVPAVPSRPVNNQSATEASIVGLKLDSQEAQILLQGAFPAGQSIQATFRGRLGEVLSRLNVRKTVTVKKSGAEIPSIKLKDLGLPEGGYTVEVVAGAVNLKTDIFFGKRDGKFLDRLEAHLRENAFELQAQKKALFYATQELDTLARDLGLNYGQLRSKPELWAKFHAKWKSQLAAVERAVAEVSKREFEAQAYPDETGRIQSLLVALKEASTLFEQGVGSQRDVASDSLTDLIAELARQKEAIGSASARAIDSPKPAGPAATSKAL